MALKLKVVSDGDKLPSVTTGLSCVILYGSQLGQAKSIAEGLCETAISFNLTATVLSLNEIKEINELCNNNLPAVIVTSTTGDGEAPENADKFFRKLRRKTLKPEALATLRYTILGLGDTNYNDFCNCGKTIHKRFQDLGAQLFYPVAWADDAVGQDQVIEDWIDGLWSAIQSEIGVFNGNLGGGDNQSEMNPLTLPACPQPFIEVTYVEAIADSIIDLLHPPAPYPSIDGEPHMAKLTNAKLLTKAGSVKTTLEITLTLAEESKGFDFEPGDAIGVICPNSSKEIEYLLKRINLKDKQHEALEMTVKFGAKNKFPAFLPTRSTLHEIFTYYVDIRTPPKKAFFRLLADFSEDPDEKSELLELSSRQGASKYEETIRFPSLSILDILLKYRSCQPNAESLLEHLPRLVPRAYSIASSPLASKTSFSLAFNIVEIPKESGRLYERRGVCTGWFEDLAQRWVGLEARSLEVGDTDPIEKLERLSLNDNGPVDIVFYKRRNHVFTLPEEMSAPVVMIGPGTGVAPFLGFIEHRHHQKEQGSKVGPMLLYFGCRHRDKDFLYEDVLTKRASERDVLTEFNVAFSRDPDQGGVKYVQDLMELNAQNIGLALLEKGGYLYVCGDAKNMAKSVRDKILGIIQQVKGLTEKEAENEVAMLVTSKRYLQDIWT